MQNIDTMDIVFTARVFARNQVEVAHRYTTGLKSIYDTNYDNAKNRKRRFH